MRFINLNVEGHRHAPRVMSFVAMVQPDILCLQETPESFVTELESRGYQVTFAPLTLRGLTPEQTYAEGVVFATRSPHTAVVHHYHDTGSDLVLFAKPRYRETMRKAVICGAVAGMHIATTHFTWTPEGAKPNAYQQEDIKSLMRILDDYPPHVLCGDLNIPRYHNRLYDEYLLPRYRDVVPEQYGSSLDRTYHRCVNDPELQHLFTDFMVDHLLVSASIEVTDVSLTFGLSDHAAVSATLQPRDR